MVGIGTGLAISAAATIGSSLLTDTDAGSSAANAQIAGQQRGIDEIRRQFEGTQENISPFVDAGLRALPGQEEAATIEGLDARLAKIFDTDIFGSLVEERGRAVGLRDAASGNFGSGAGFLDAARVPLDQGLFIENLLAGRNAGLTDQGLSAATGLGTFGANAAANIAGLNEGQGLAAAQGSLADADARAARNDAIFGSIGGVGSALAGGAGTSAGFGSGGASQLASGFLSSDRRLKENIVKVTELGGLNVYRWDWVEAAKKTLVGQLQKVGFMADEVKKLYPAFVFEFAGYDAIDYDGLLSKLETV